MVAVVKYAQYENDLAIAAFGELVELVNLVERSEVYSGLRAEIKEFLDSGPVVTRCEIVGETTPGAGDGRMVCKPSDSLLEVLTTLRARKRQLDGIS